MIAYEWGETLIRRLVMFIHEWGKAISNRNRIEHIIRTPRGTQSRRRRGKIVVIVVEIIINIVLRKALVSDVVLYSITRIFGDMA